MRPYTVVFAALAAALSAAPAFAQVERLPTVSRAERQLDDINGSLRTQQQLRRAEQQTQFEVNQLRTQIQRDQTFPTPGSTRVCAPGQLGC
jgi:hypothetical protein